MKYTMFQIQEAIKKNICAPDDTEIDFTVSRIIRASTKREGDSQLGIILFVGLATEAGYSYSDIESVASLQKDEFKFKLSKYRRKSRSNDIRFLTKIKLIKNYLRLKYGI